MSAFTPSTGTLSATSHVGDELKGYLHKKTTQGKWQKRWFETNGCFLTYYRRQGEKLLAALNLPKVGSIDLLEEDDPDGPGLFTIELNERTYTLKAESHAEASRWVQGLHFRQRELTSNLVPPLQATESSKRVKAQDDKIPLVPSAAAATQVARAMTDNSLAETTTPATWEKQNEVNACCCNLQ